MRTIPTTMGKSLRAGAITWQAQTRAGRLATMAGACLIAMHAGAWAQTAPTAVPASTANAKTAKTTPAAKAPAASATSATSTSSASAPGTPSRAAPGTPRHLLWSDLVPKNWDPMVDYRERFKDPKLAAMDDGDPRMLEMMREMREIWDKAPVNMEMNGVAGRIPGYVVPLDDTRKGMKSFLLVPYYGACIHSPPPPANQIVLVHSDKPIKGFQSMDTVWVQGTLQAARGDSAMGVSGWRIDAVKVEHYERPPVQTAP